MLLKWSLKKTHKKTRLSNLSESAKLVFVLIKLDLYSFL